MIFFFFFSSRRRHTRWTGDWSSDVCSSDLIVIAPATANVLAKAALGIGDDLLSTMLLTARCPLICAPAMDGGMRSEERRVGKERRARRSGYQDNEKKIIAATDYYAMLSEKL